MHWLLTLSAILFMPSLEAGEKALHPQKPTAKPTVKPIEKVKEERRGAMTISFKVEKYQLKNGLKILLHADKKAPLVHFQTWFRAGSRDDPPNEAGMAHLFEHMMFRETHKRKNFKDEVDKKGIGWNAYTTYDRTVYHFNLPKKELEFIAKLEAERMRELKINEKNLKLEKDIVREEKSVREDNNPQRKVEDLMGLLFQKNLYRRPIIGYDKSIDHITVGSSQKFYKTFYAPNNALLVISGPIHIAKTKKIIQKYYGSLKPSPPPQRDYPKEPPQKSARTKNLYRFVQNASLLIGWPRPPIHSKDSYALELLAFILGGSQSSLLNQELVEKKEAAVSAYAYQWNFQDAGVFMIGSSLRPEANLKKAAALITAQVKKLRDTLLTDEDLQRAKANVIKQYIDELKTAEGKADALGLYEMEYGDYNLLFEAPMMWSQVSAEELLALAKKHLTPHQQTLIQLYPKK